jgi:hypothetical protein
LQDLQAQSNQKLLKFITPRLKSRGVFLLFSQIDNILQIIYNGSRKAGAFMNPTVQEYIDKQKEIAKNKELENDLKTVLGNRRKIDDLEYIVKSYLEEQQQLQELTKGKYGRSTFGVSSKQKQK